MKMRASLAHFPVSWPRGLLALALVVATTPSAQGALWLPFNLNTLVMESDAIVLAEKIGTRNVTDARGRSFALTRYRVEKVHSGPLLPGEVLELHDGGYPRQASGPFGEAPDAGFEDRIVAFLQRSERQRYSELRQVAERDRPRFAIVHSGLRLLSEGKVYTFGQFMNPGGIVPVPQRTRDLSGHITLEELEKDIRHATARVETLRRARDLKDPSKRRKLLLGTLGEYEAEAKRREKIAGVGSFLDAKDLFLQGLVDLLLESDDVEGALQVFATWPYESVRLEVDQALSAAADRAIPPRLRAAAVATLEWRNFCAPATIRALGELLGDPAGEVRAAAAARLEYLRRGYARNKSSHTEELDEVWARADAKLSRASRRDDVSPGGEAVETER